MAITIDQFLHDLTERELLSTEDVHAFRRELIANSPDPVVPKRIAEQVESGSTSGEQSTKVAPPASLILCDCLIQDKIQVDENHLIFNARRLRDDSPATIHVLMPGHRQEGARADSNLNGFASSKDKAPTSPRGIVDVVRHGEMVCICCQPMESETLEQLVLQNGTLPLELATETLLQTARTLKRVSEQGLSPCEVSPELLLVDEDGHVHLTGNQLAQLVRPANCHCEDHDSPVRKLPESLGKLYDFLLTGRAWPADSNQNPSPIFLESADADVETALRQSAKQVYARLVGQEGTSRYHEWDELIRDLEFMLAGREIPATPAVEMANPSSSSIAPPPASEATSHSAREALVSVDAGSSKVSSPNALWWIVGLALLAAAILAILMLLGN